MAFQPLHIVASPNNTPTHQDRMPALIVPSAASVRWMRSHPIQGSTDITLLLESFGITGRYIRLGQSAPFARSAARGESKRDDGFSLDQASIDTLYKTKVPHSAC